MPFKNGETKEVPVGDKPETESKEVDCKKYGSAIQMKYKSPESRDLRRSETE